MNTWRYINEPFGRPPALVSSCCGGQGVTIVFSWPNRSVHRRSDRRARCRVQLSSDSTRIPIGFAQ
jgi:hypothetical protein